MQKLIFEHRADYYDEIVNRHLTEGWRVVPGTIGGVKSQYFNPNTKKSEQHGVSSHYWCVIEHDMIDGE